MGRTSFRSSLVQIWSKFGPDGSGLGQLLARFEPGLGWARFGLDLVQILSRFVPGLGQICSGFGPDLVQVCSRFGPSQVWARPAGWTRKAETLSQRVD